MLSRNKVNSTKQISSKECLEFMKKLNRKKIKGIIKGVEKKDKGVWTIALVQNVAKQQAYRVYNKYKNGAELIFKKSRRKPREVSNKERKLVINTYKEYIASATMIEQILDEKGIHIN